MADTVRPEDILTPEELAARLNVRKSWVYEQTRPHNRNRFSLPCLAIGRYIRFDWTRVVGWLTDGDRNGPVRSKRRVK